jgi:predicted MFS family arabinose efflux permease
MPPAAAATSDDWRAAWREPVFRLGLTIALIGGMVDAAVAGLFAPFAQGRGLSVGQAAELLAVFGGGGLAMQYAAGWLADRHGVRAAAGVCAVGTALAAAALVQPIGPVAVVAAVFLLGGFVTAFLTLALVAGTSTAAGGTARNVSALTMLYTGGGVLGPLGAGAAMAATRGDALMWLTAAAAGTLAFAVWLGGRVASGRVGPGHRRGGGFG